MKQKKITPFWAAFFYCLLCTLPLIAQTNSEKGQPFITNYSPKAYLSSQQIWSVAEGNNGLMYFGLQAGIVEYDGVKWKKVNVPGPSSNIIRALNKDENGRMYYGAYGDFGYLYTDSLGQTKAASLLKTIPAAYRNFFDVWTIYGHNGFLYIQSREYIFRLKQRAGKGSDDYEVKVWKPETKFMYAFHVNGQYFVHQQGLGMYQQNNDSLQLIAGSEFLGKERVQIMLPFKGPANEPQYLLGMFYSGLIHYDGKTFKPYASDIDGILKSGTILYKGMQLVDGSLVLCTTGEGIFIVDDKGKLQQTVNRKHGLQDESIYSICQNKNGTLWAGLDNGISSIETSSSLTKFDEASGISSTPLSVGRYNNSLYVGISNGLVKFNQTNKQFEPVKGVTGSQVFSLLPNEANLLLTSDGLYGIENNQLKTIKESISSDLGLTCLLIPKNQPDLLLGGGNSGIAVFKRPKTGSNQLNNWQFLGFVEKIKDAIWTICEDGQGNIWAGTQNEICFRLKPFKYNNDLPDLVNTVVNEYGSDLKNQPIVGSVYAINKQIYTVHDTGFYRFNEAANRFDPDTTLGHFSEGGGLQLDSYLVEDYLGRVWMRHGRTSKLALPQANGTYKVQTILQSISGYFISSFYPEKSGITWIATTEGLIRYDERIEKGKQVYFNALLRLVTAGGDTLPIFSTNSAGKIPKVVYQNRYLRFEYAAPFFEQEKSTQYQTWLEGFEPAWSHWDDNYYKEFTNLSPGKYTFHIRAKNVYQVISSEAVFSFEILSPWYLRWWAFLLYALVLSAITFGFIRYRTRQLYLKHKALEELVALRTTELSQKVEEVQLAKIEAEEARKNAEKANEAKSSFLSTVSHELRTPLTSVLGFAKIIRKRLEEKIFPLTDQSDPKIAKTVLQISENLGVVVSEGERLTNLINEVLDLAKIEAGKMEWHFDNLNLAEVAERAIAATSSLFDQKNLTLLKNIDKNLPPISGDRDKLIQVMVNLLSNAVKFTPEGTVTCSVTANDKEVVASITDTGIGIAGEDHSAVFEQFKQVGGDTLTDKPKGTGLGLPICKQIVEHHGGRIWMESQPGVGSTFFFAIPLVKSDPVKLIHLNDLLKQLKAQVTQSELGLHAKYKNILIVDDEAAIRSLLRQELSEAGYTINEAGNGKEALAKIRANKPDLILLDVMMPEMNGFDLAAILKNDPQTMDIPIIIISIVQDKARGFRIGVDRYLNKPIDTNELFAEVGSLLEQGKAKKKVLLVDEDEAAVKSLTEVLQEKGYAVVESDGKNLVANAIALQPDIIILNSQVSGNQQIVQSLRFEKGLENVLFFIYQ